MSLDFEELLFDLLVRVRACRRHAQKVEYSREDERTLWDGGDRVEHADGAGKYSFYVTLHHFSGEDGLRRDLKHRLAQKRRVIQSLH